MRILASCGLLLLGMAASGWAQAEQGCPAGFAPLGQPPAPICQPMPGYSGSNNGGYSTPSQPRMPQPRWQERWGAIAIDVNAAKMGTAVNRKSSRDAERTALKECKSKGGTEKDCRRTLLVYGNGCGAVAMGKEGVVARGGSSIEDASARALKQCGIDTTDCEVLYTKCSYPVLVSN